MQTVIVFNHGKVEFMVYLFSSVSANIYFIPLLYGVELVDQGKVEFICQYSKVLFILLDSNRLVNSCTKFVRPLIGHFVTNYVYGLCS